jgi:bifunctional DNA-binding transcriptional regulator/antitoxin component of YhaV-PrlF toxin-antitoxin module
MSSKVGLKGQIVIEKTLRDKLGVKPGWQALQLLVDDHVEIYFVPPEHTNSLAGRLAKYTKGSLKTSEALRKERDKGWSKASRKEL